MTKRLPVHSIDATGTRDGTTALHGDGTWKAPTTDPEVVRDTMAAALVAGSGVTITPDDAANTITVAATGGGGGSLTVQDENGNVATGVTQLDFQGAGVTASAGTGEVVVTIPSGGGGGVAASTGVVNTGTETTTSTTATNLATAGPSATVTVGASGKVLVSVHAVVWNSTVGAGTNVWVDVSGANTIATATPYVVSGLSPSATAGQSTSGTFLYTGLAAGSTTFTLKYSASAGTGSFARRVITATTF